MTIKKEGKTKDQLLECLESLRKRFRDEIKDYDIRIRRIKDGYRLSVKKTYFFKTYKVDASIYVTDGRFEIEWDTNVPPSKVEKAKNKIRSILGGC
ncbi:MAG: hypothetical protein N2510_09935 [Ignavibacteria bacterium]|nr:hypothetical protein [Ignavibacteria bacterium]